MLGEAAGVAVLLAVTHHRLQGLEAQPMRNGGGCRMRLHPNQERGGGCCWKFFVKGIRSVWLVPFIL